MFATHPSTPRHAAAAALVGWIVGTALQLAQPTLWPQAGYALALGVAVAAAMGCWLAVRRWPWTVARLLLLVAAGAAAFGVCGLRAQAFAQQGLNPALEGRDLRIVGIVAAMPQRSDDSLRLRLEVESAYEGAAARMLPPLIDIGWYAPRGGDDALDAVAPVPAVHAGERWSMMVRLKAPHGNRNPHGFDYELWLWEQGVQATGYVRAGSRDVPPRLLGATWRHPVEQARQAVRDAIQARLGLGGDAGVVAALVTGDQRAIDRADWDIFRTTGVAHLMSISGLHITMFAWLATLAVGALWRRNSRLCLWLPAPVAALLAGVLLATGYALFSGWGVPA
ncbi:MAG TPA: ComEC/Rec2 family competence protein, partial [Burkholderiaceae bacterium]